MVCSRDMNKIRLLFLAVFTVYEGVVYMNGESFALFSNRNRWNHDGTESRMAWTVAALLLSSEIGVEGKAE